MRFNAARSPDSTPEPVAGGSETPEIDGGVLIETEQVLMRFAPEKLRYTAAIRKEGRNRAADQLIPVGFKHYRVCIPPEARREILQTLRIAARRYEFGTIPHLFRLVSLWEQLAGR